MAYAFVKNTASTVGNTAALAINFTGTPSTGALVVVVSSAWSGSAEVLITSITDNADTPGGTTNKWQLGFRGSDMSTGASVGRAEIWYTTIEATRGSGNFTMTINYTNSASCSAAAVEFSTTNSRGGDRDRYSGSVNLVANTAPDTGETSPTLSNDEVAVAVAITNSGTNVTWTENQSGTIGTYTQFAEVTNNNPDQAMHAVYQVLSSQAAQRHVWLADGDVSDDTTGGVLVTFRETQLGTGSQAGFSRHLVP